jgi:O-antigen/teichoic acid export membrane protein
MIGKRQQLANSGLYVLPIVIGNLAPIITLPIFTRLLSKEDFGAFALANAYAVVVGGIAGVGLPIAYDRNYFECRTGRESAKLFYSIVGFASLSFLVFGLLTWALRAPIAEGLFGATGYEEVVVWSFWSTAIVSIKTYYLTYLRNSEQAAAHSAYSIGERVLATVLTLVLVAWMRLGVMGLVIGQLLASLVILALLVARFLREFRPAFEMRLLRDALKIGYPLMPRIVIGVIGNNFDKYLIGQLTSLGGVGIYSIGQRVANIAFTYMTALQNVFGPQVYTRMFSDDPAAGRSIGHYLTPFAYVSTVLAFLIAVFSEEILAVLAPRNFHGAVPIVTILAVYYGIQFFGKLPQITFAKKTHLISILAAVSTGLSMALGAAGVWLLGTIGAAWGALAAGALSITLTLLVGQRCYRIEWEQRRMAAIFGLLAAGAFLTVALRVMDVSYSVRLAAKLIALVAFGWLGIRLRVITVENLSLVRDLLRSYTKRSRVREGSYE